MSDVLHNVKPLGLFGVIAEQAEFEQMRDELLALGGGLPDVERAPIARYLRAGTVIVALMMHSWDVIGGISQTRIEREQLRRGLRLDDVVGGKFVVSGGAGIQTDGAYYWRGDTADYVEHYGVRLPEDFLRHGRSLGWISPALTQEEIIAVDRYLVKHARRLPHDNRKK